MDVTTLIALTIKVSVFLIVLGLGLRATPADVTWLFRHPPHLFRSIAAMNVVMPVLTTLLVAALPLRQPVEIALVLLSISPVPPILPRKQVRLGGNEPYVYGLLVAAAVLAIVFVPLAVAVLAAVFGRGDRAPVELVAKVVAMTVLAPLVLGVLLRRLAPGLGARVEPVVSRLGMVLVVIAGLLMLLGLWSTVVSLIGNGTILAIIGVVVIGLAVGHLLGGPRLADRAVLAVACAARHPGMTMAIATLNSPGQRDVTAAVGLYLLTSIVLTIPYVRWCKRRLVAAAAAPSAVHV